MVKGILKRLFPVLCCIVVLISCMVVPASAMGSLVLNDSPRQWYPNVGCRVYLRVDYKESDIFDDADPVTVEDSFRALDRVDAYPKELSIRWPDYYESFSSRPNSYVYNDVTRNIWIQGYENIRSSSSDANAVHRIGELFEVNRQEVNEMNQSSFITENAYYKVVLDDFGGAYDRSYLSSLFYVDGQFRYQVFGTFYTIQDNKLISYPFIFSPFTSNGQQSIFTQNYLNNFEKNTGISEGQPFFISNLTVNFLEKEQFLKISRLATLDTGRLSFFDLDYPIYGVGYTLDEFLTQHGLVTGPSSSFLAGDDITDFIGGAASSVFDAKLFGDFSLGSVLTTLFTVAVVFWLLKVFAGG